MVNSKTQSNSIELCVCVWGGLIGQYTFNTMVGKGEYTHIISYNNGRIGSGENIDIIEQSNC